jgi:DNA-binding transcriptional ArsR family regulator
VLECLKAGPQPVVEIAKRLPVSRPAVSQHLRILKAAGLVEDHPQGNRRLYSVRREALAELRSYLESYWDTALAGYKVAAEERSTR